MTLTRRGVWAAVALLTCSLAACSGTPTTPQPTTAAPTGPASATVIPTGSAGATGPAPAPAATESNPPGDIPDNQAFVVFRVPGSRASLKVPEGWARSGAGNATTFSDKLNRIEIAASKAGSAPTAASVTRDDVAKLQSSVPRLSLGKVTGTQRSAGPVVLVTYQGDSAQDPVTGKVVRDAFERYVFYRGGERVDLTLSGPTNADNVDPWRTVSDSVTWP